MTVGNTIGIIGDALQIQSMLVVGRQYGYHMHSYHSNQVSMSVANLEVIGTYDDKDALIDFAAHVDVLLIATNEVDVDLLYRLSSYTNVFQSFELVEMAQNRMVEKLYLEEHTINVAPYSLITSVGELPGTLSSIGFPAMLEVNRTRGERKFVMLYDHDMEDYVIEMIDHQPCMLTAWIPFQRQYTVTVARDFDGHTVVLPIVENTYVNNRLKYAVASKRLNPEWAEELQRIGKRFAESLSGCGVISIDVMLATNGIFYVERVNMEPSFQQSFSLKQTTHSLAEIYIRTATGLPIADTTLHQEAVIIPIYGSMIEKVRLLSCVKPQWEFEFYKETEHVEDNEIIGVIRLSGESSVDLLNEVEICELF